MSQIPITLNYIKGLRKAYDLAIQNKQPEFEYNGNEFVTDYAKYLLEFYEPQFKLK